MVEASIISYQIPSCLVVPPPLQNTHPSITTLITSYSIVSDVFPNKRKINIQVNRLLNEALYLQLEHRYAHNHSQKNRQSFLPKAPVYNCYSIPNTYIP
jgi:hypothetical protein